MSRDSKNDSSTNGRPKRSRMVAEIMVRCKPQLKKIIAQLAEDRGPNISLGEVCVDLICKQLKRDDLNVVPRKSFGRPKNEIVDDDDD